MPIEYKIFFTAIVLLFAVPIVATALNYYDILGGELTNKIVNIAVIAGVFSCFIFVLFFIWV